MSAERKPPVPAPPPRSSHAGQAGLPRRFPTKAEHIAYMRELASRPRRQRRAQPAVQVAIPFDALTAEQRRLVLALLRAAAPESGVSPLTVPFERADDESLDP